MTSDNPRRSQRVIPNESPSIEELNEQDFLAEALRLIEEAERAHHSKQTSRLPSK